MISREDSSLVDYALYLCFMVRLKLMFVKREGSDGKPQDSPYSRISRQGPPCSINLAPGSLGI